MIPPEPPDRFVTQAARQRLDGVFGFLSHAYMQDWEIVLSDGQRLAEFIDAYDALSLDDDERFALMALIVASSHDALDFCGLTDSQWRLVHDRLVSHADLHASKIYYWCCVGATCDDECFTLTSRMRRVCRCPRYREAAIDPMDLSRRVGRFDKGRSLAAAGWLGRGTRFPTELGIHGPSLGRCLKRNWGDDAPPSWRIKLHSRR